ncbi:MAG TPA: hypothetical protein DEP35_18135 [Deltaproteobacteria bacterium]|nr:hypothetical protein [Deltaproteobacteria bacterium]
MLADPGLAPDEQGREKEPSPFHLQPKERLKEHRRVPRHRQIDAALPRKLYHVPTRMELRAQMTSRSGIRPAPACFGSRSCLAKLLSLLPFLFFS